MNDMDSEETAEGPVAATSSTQEAVKPGPRARRTRGITAWVLVVLVSLLIPI